MRRRREPAGDRDQHGDQQEDADRGADDPPRPVDVLAAPNAWPMRMVEAMPKPNTKAISRNMTMLALEVAASASSPRKRPTQIALIDAVQRLEDRARRASAARRRAGSWRSALREVAASAARSASHAPRSRRPACQFLARPGLRPCRVTITQPLQRRAQPLGLGGLGVMVGAGLFDRFGLGALGEIRIGEALRRGCRAPSRRPRRLSTGAPFRRRGRSRLPAAAT